MNGESILHDDRNPSESFRGDLASSPPPADLPAQDLQDSNILDMTGPFEPEMIANLPQMTIQQLSKFEEHLSEEFATLAQEYIAARKSRVDYMQNNVEAQMKSFQNNDISWSKFYNQQVKHIDLLATLTEDTAIKDNSSSRSYQKSFVATAMDFESELEQLTAEMESPLEFDAVFKQPTKDIPFGEYFKEIIDLHKAQLMASLHQMQYQSDLTDSITEKNRVILWKQYKSDVLQYKESLISQTCEKLENLHREYYGVLSNTQTAKDLAQYYKSVVPIETSRDNVHGNSQILLAAQSHDKYHDVDNIYHKNNRVQITDTKEVMQKESLKFSARQDQYKIAQLNSVTVKLAGCLGVSQKEADEDLALMRPNTQISIIEDDHSEDAMDEDAMDDDAFSSDSHEIFYDSDEEEYHSILNIDRSPIKRLMTEHNQPQQ